MNSTVTLESLTKEQADCIVELFQSGVLGDKLNDYFLEKGVEMIELPEITRDKFNSKHVDHIVDFF